MPLSRCRQALNGLGEIARDPLILTRISLRQEWAYTRYLLMQRMQSGGQKTTARQYVLRMLRAHLARQEHIDF